MCFFRWLNRIENLFLLWNHGSFIRFAFVVKGDVTPSLARAWILGWGKSNIPLIAITILLTIKVSCLRHFMQKNSFGHLGNEKLRKELFRYHHYMILHNETCLFRIVWRCSKSKKSQLLTVKSKSETVVDYMNKMVAPFFNPIYLVNAHIVQFTIDDLFQLAKVEFLIVLSNSLRWNHFSSKLVSFLTPTFSSLVLLFNEDNG